MDKVSEGEKIFTLHEESPFPEYGEEGKEFKAFMTKQYDLMHQLGIKIMSHIAEGLGKPLSFFDKWFVNDTCSTFRVIHY